MYIWISRVFWGLGSLVGGGLGSFLFLVGDRDTWQGTGTRHASLSRNVTTKNKNG